MVIGKRSLPRRTFLRGIGAAVALPFLESMAPAMTPMAQSPARPPLRFGAVYLPYSCAYMNTISWASETAGLPMEIDPRAAFERMFGRAGSPADRQIRRREDRSILDSILQEARTLRTKVGAPDRVRLDNYLENVRE